MVMYHIFEYFDRDGKEEWYCEANFSYWRGSAIVIEKNRRNYLMLKTVRNSYLWCGTKQNFRNNFPFEYFYVRKA